MPVHRKPHRVKKKASKAGRKGRRRGQRITVMKDRLKQKRAAGRASDAARLAAIVENSDDAILSKSLDGTILTWNAAAEKLFGYAEREAVGKSITIIVPADRLDEEEEILSRIVKGMKVDHFETVRLTKSGEEVQVSVTVSPVRDDKGKIVGASKIARNIAQQKAAEARARVLSGELDHRVKNALAVVASLAKNMLESATSLDEFGPTFEGRLLALARAHRLLSDSSWEGATVRRILDRIVAPLCRGPGQLKMSGDEAMIPARAAPALAQVLHELATNAVKYGAFSTREGRIEVRWEISSVRDMGRLHLTWTEKDGPPVREPTRTGFGTELIRGTIEHQYGGAVKIEYRPVGMRCEFDIGWSQSTVRVAGAE